MNAILTGREIRARRRARQAFARGASGTAVLALVVACGGSPARPTSPAPTGAGTVSGVVLSVVERVPIPGASVKVGDRSATADANGRFELTGVPEIGEFPFVIDAAGHFQRRTSVRLRYLASHPDVEVDLIPHTAPFDYNFFRQFAETSSSGARPVSSHCGRGPFRRASTSTSG